MYGEQPVHLERRHFSREGGQGLYSVMRQIKRLRLNAFRLRISVNLIEEGHMCTLTEKVKTWIEELNEM